MAHPGKPSLTRWTSMLPAFGFMALWQYIGGNLAHHGLHIALKKPGLESLTASVEAAISDEGWRLCEGARLHHAFQFTDDTIQDDSICSSTVLSVVSAIVNTPIQHASHLILQWESEYHRHPATRRMLARNQRLRKAAAADPEQAHANEPTLPIALRLVRGEGINACLEEGAQVLVYICLVSSVSSSR